MREQRSWRVEIKWWLSSFVALLAVLLVFGLIKAGLSLATISAADLVVAGVTNPGETAIGWAGWWPIAALLVFYPYFVGAAIGFRLLVPAFAGAPPRAVAAVVTTWPLALGAALVSLDVASTLLFAAVGVAWGLTMPMPRQTVLSNNPVKGGATVGLAFGAFAQTLGVEWAIVWCVLRLFRGKTLEVAATAICAAIIPALLLMSELPHASRTATGMYVTAEVLMLAGLSLAGFILWNRSQGDSDSDDDVDDEAIDAAELAEVQPIANQPAATAVAASAVDPGRPRR